MDVNFLFSKGEGLFNELIDANRVQQVIGKIKDQAKEQEEDNSKDINYSEIVEFLNKKDMGMNVSYPENREDLKWNNVVNFMRANPKLMMEMIPDAQEPYKNQGNMTRVGKANEFDFYPIDMRTD